MGASTCLSTKPSSGPSRRRPSSRSRIRSAHPLPDACWVGTVHHGAPEKLLTPTGTRPEYLAFLGRISPEKGLPNAIRVARRCGLPLKIAAKVDKVDADYFAEEIKPLLHGPEIEFVGEISDEEKSEFLSGAIALLTLIDWPEPFGLVMIEAMACGTPVIAFRRGAAPEIIDDGVTGFIVDGEAEAAAAVSRAAPAFARACAGGLRGTFHSRRMAADYVDIYQKLTHAPRSRIHRVSMAGRAATAIRLRPCRRLDLREERQATDH